MELIFLGRGAAFNPKEKNTSAYFIEDNKLFLIDCGETVFKSIIENNILEGINEIELMLTHTHSDHIGSLGSLIMYCYYEAKIKVNIITCENAKYLSNIKAILDNMGCSRESYEIVREEEYDDKYKDFKKIRFIETTHTDKLNCYSIIFETTKGIVYYSGDSNNYNFIKELIEKNEEIDKLYIDTTSDDSSHNHIFVGILDHEIPYEVKNKIYCMHINNNECIELAKSLGFNIVEVKKIDQEKRD